MHRDGGGNARQARGAQSAPISSQDWKQAICKHRANGTTPELLVRASAANTAWKHASEHYGGDGMERRPPVMGMEQPIKWLVGLGLWDEVRAIDAMASGGARPSARGGIGRVCPPLPHRRHVDARVLGVPALRARGATCRSLGVRAPPPGGAAAQGEGTSHHAPGARRQGAHGWGGGRVLGPDHSLAGCGGCGCACVSPWPGRQGVPRAELTAPWGSGRSVPARSR